MLFQYYKGFSRAAAHTLHTAVILAGRQGCSAADTGSFAAGHAADCPGTGGRFPAAQTDHRVRTARLRAGKKLRDAAVSRQTGPGPRDPEGHGVRGAGRPCGQRGPGRKRTSALRHAGGYILYGQRLAGVPGHRGTPGCAGSAASSRGRWYCRHSRGWRPPAAADPARSTAGISPGLPRRDGWTRYCAGTPSWPG